MFPVNLFSLNQYIPESFHFIFLQSYIPFCSVIPKLKTIVEKTIAQINTVNCLLFKMVNFNPGILLCQ